MFMRAVHPGAILKDELDELGITPTEFARQIDVPPNRVSQIIGGKRSITGDTMAAAETLIKKAGGEVVANFCIIELEGLGGRDKLSAPFETLLKCKA